MAIQVKRGTSTQRKASNITLLAGQPFFETDTNRVYVGDGSTLLKNLKGANAGIVKNVYVDASGYLHIDTWDNTKVD